MSHFHYSPGSAITWAPKAQGRVSWVSLTPNMWCLSKQHPIPQTPTGCATTQFNSDRKSGKLTYILHVEVSELSSLQRPAMWAHPSWFDKVSKTGKFHYLTPCSITQLIWWPTSGRQLTCRSHSNIKDKSRHTEMSEMCKAKWKWSCGETQCPREHRTLISPTSLI